ncbi:hypothetical protein SRHO_G00230320 [Serrasalmus rhombeus]
MGTPHLTEQETRCEQARRGMLCFQPCTELLVRSAALFPPESCSRIRLAEQHFHGRQRRSVNSQLPLDSDQQGERRTDLLSEPNGRKQAGERTWTVFIVKQQ